MPRWRARTDANHAEIRDGLRAEGLEVWDCARHGNGFPDLLVNFCSTLWLLEVKSKGGKLTEKEALFYKGFGSRVRIVHNLKETLDFFKSFPEWGEWKDE